MAADFFGSGSGSSSKSESASESKSASETKLALAFLPLDALDFAAFVAGPGAGSLFS